MRARDFSNRKLVIFDIDDTLVNTDTRVNVVRDGEVVKQLNSHDFTHYQLQPGEEFDFGRFRDAREFYTNARPIVPMIKQLKNDMATGNRVIMLTARADFNDRDLFLDTFRKYGIDMSRVHVYRAGNLNVKAATEEKKKIILQHLLGKEHYDKVIMYDDSVPNLNAFLSLKQDYPWSKFYAWHVDPNGQADEYHRSDIKEAVYVGNLGVQELAQFLIKHPELKKQYYDIKSQSGVRAALDFVLDKMNVSLQGQPFLPATNENFADGRVKGRSRPGRVKRAGASCKGSVTDLRARARKYGGERGRMYHWCANMKSGRKK